MEIKETTINEIELIYELSKLTFNGDSIINIILNYFYEKYCDKVY
jgi:hypothetical protein